jgi:hypothetical protein
MKNIFAEFTAQGLVTSGQGEAGGRGAAAGTRDTQRGRQGADMLV